MLASFISNNCEFILQYKALNQIARMDPKRLPRRVRIEKKPYKNFFSISSYYIYLSTNSAQNACFLLLVKQASVLPYSGSRKMLKGSERHLFPQFTAVISCHVIWRQFCTTKIYSSHMLEFLQHRAQAELQTLLWFSHSRHCRVLPKPQPKCS